MNAAATWKVDATMILSRAEIGVVVADLKRRAKRSVNSRMNLAIFRLSTCCGLRVSEIIGLKLSDVRVGIARPYINLRKAIAKGGKARRVPLWWDAGTLADIEAWKTERQDQGANPPEPFICSQAADACGYPLDRQAARKRFLVACRALGKDRQAELTIHHGRHSFVSHALAGGRSVTEVRDAAGHSSINTTSLYAHVVTDDEEEVGDLFRFAAA